MARGNTDLSSYDYDNYLASRKTSRHAVQELRARHVERKRAHNSEGVGWHFGLGDAPVKVESREHLKEVLDKHGLMLAHEVKKNLR